MQCQRCHRQIKPGQEYRHGSQTLCADCCMELRTPRKRKTHWQYLTAIRIQYLQPGPDEKPTPPPKTDSTTITDA